MITPDRPWSIVRRHARPLDLTAVSLAEAPGHCLAEDIRAGNPLSALTALHEFALPALRRLSGYPAESCRPEWLLPLADAAESKGGRVRCELARLVNRESGLAVAAVPSRSSADLVSAGYAGGVMVLPSDQTRCAAGQLVAFRPWRPLP